MAVQLGFRRDRLQSAAKCRPMTLVPWAMEEKSLNSGVYLEISHWHCLITCPPPLSTYSLERRFVVTAGCTEIRALDTKQTRSCFKENEHTSLVFIFPAARHLLSSHSEHKSLALSTVLLVHCTLVLCLALNFLFRSLIEL